MLFAPGKFMELNHIAVDSEITVFLDAITTDKEILDQITWKLKIDQEEDLCDESHFYLYFSSFFPYISVPISIFSLSSCDMSLTLSLPLSWIVTMSLTSLLLCHHL